MEPQAEAKTSPASGPDYRESLIPSLDNRDRRFTQSLVPTPVRQPVEEIEDQRPTAELRVVKAKRHLLKLVKPMTDSLAVPDELLQATAPTPTDMEIPAIVRMPTPLRLKDSPPPLRRVEKAHQPSPRTAAFRARTIPLPPRVLFAETGDENVQKVPAGDDGVATVRFPTPSPARTPPMPKKAVVGAMAVEQVAAAWPNLSGKARRVIMDLVENHR